MRFRKLTIGGIRVRKLGRVLAYSVWFGAASTVIIGCGGGGSSGSSTVGPTNPVGPVTPPLLGNVSSISFTEVNVGFNRKFSTDLALLSDAERFGGGAAAGDIDNDGDVDLYVVGRDDDPNHMYVNLGNNRFEEVGSEMGVNVSHWGSGPAFGDIDGDGDLDLFVGAVANYPIFLFENRLGEGEGFVDITRTSGLSTPARNTVSALFYDYDRDGFLDLIVTHWGQDWPTGNDSYTIWRNNGDKSFSSMSVESGIATTLVENGIDWSFTPSFSDIDNDGDGDLLIASDFGESQVYLNEDDGTFTRITDRDVIIDQNGMGSAVGDFDNDGDMDWFVTSIYDLDTDEGGFFGNRLYRNTGNGVFDDVTEASGTADGDWGWGACTGDFDNDGFLDLVQVNGWVTTDYKDFQRRPMRFFYNTRTKGLIFTDVHDEVGLSNDGQGRAIVCFDSDQDGDLDIVLVNGSIDHIIYYRNDSRNLGNYLVVELEGLGANRFGIGARITVTTSEHTLIRDLGSSNNFTSHDPFEVHFGIGSSSTVDVAVGWPDGTITELDSVEANQRIKVAATESNLRLVVISGEGTGAYGLGERITIQAKDPEEGYYFSHWSGSDDSIVFDDKYSQITMVTMPNRTVSVKANYLPGVAPSDPVSVARRWNEILLQAIRNDYARPTVHARNLFHVSAAMYDAWSAFRPIERPWLLGAEQAGSACEFDSSDVESFDEAAVTQAISLAAYRLIRHRFEVSPGASRIARDADSLLEFLGYDRTNHSQDYTSGEGAALGNYIAACYVRFGLNDHSNEVNDYANVSYDPINPALKPHEPGNANIEDLNRWQPLSLLAFIDQAGNPSDSEPDFLSPEWGQVWPFALDDEDLTVYQRDGFDYWVYHDPGPPPLIGGNAEEFYKWGFELVAHWASHLDAEEEVSWDISPKSIGNIQNYPDALDLEGYESFYDDLNGGDSGLGHVMNPSTGLPYDEQLVPRGDYTRVLAEFWADGPESETPPGHWFVIVNEVNEHPLLERKFGGTGPELEPLEWDIKIYFSLGGAMHDAAITAWGIKGWYDYIRPISSIRAMSDRGQSSDESMPSYDSWGIGLVDGYVELVEADDPLAGEESENVGKVKIRSWRGPDFVEDPTTDIGGVGWILAENWWPYQRPSFVTPPFAGYVSGHSTYSRAAAEVLTAITGDAFFPGGMSSFEIAKNDFLVFEKGPSVDMTLQWATYTDASDQCSLSRIWGGIHPPADDIPGRLIGIDIGQDAFAHAKAYFDGELPNE